MEADSYSYFEIAFAVLLFILGIAVGAFIVYQRKVKERIELEDAAKAERRSKIENLSQQVQSLKDDKYRLSFCISNIENESRQHQEQVGMTHLMVAECKTTLFSENERLKKVISQIDQIRNAFQAFQDSSTQNWRERALFDSISRLKHSTDTLNEISESIADCHNRYYRKTGPFAFLQSIPDMVVCELLCAEEPHDLAIILPFLKPERAGAVLSMVPKGVATEVYRLLLSDEVYFERAEQLERELVTKFSLCAPTAKRELAFMGEIFRFVEGSARDEILELFEQVSPEAAKQLRQNTFTFDDLLFLDDYALQQILNEVDKKELAVALKGANETVRERIFDNLPRRTVENIIEDMEFMGPVRVASVAEAQDKILTIILRREEAGEIVLTRRPRETRNSIPHKYRLDSGPAEETIPLSSFDELFLLNDRDLITVLREIRPLDLVNALWGADEEKKSRIYRNLPSKTFCEVYDQLEKEPGVVETNHIEEAKNTITQVMRRLNEAGELEWSRTVIESQTGTDLLI